MCYEIEILQQIIDNAYEGDVQEVLAHIKICPLCRENFDKFVKIILNFLEENNINLSKIDNIFINKGPGQYTSIRSAISIVKALKISKKINIYGYYSTQIINNNYDILFNLLKEGRLTKNFIQPKYLN